MPQKLKKKVVVTGACGKIANQVIPALRERYDELVLLDIRAGPQAGGDDAVTPQNVQVANIYTTSHAYALSTLEPQALEQRST
eukprot:SAG11_NODE_2874_length_2880_cov_2.944624_1_plen_83_part_00